MGRLDAFFAREMAFFPNGFERVYEFVSCGCALEDDPPPLDISLWKVFGQFYKGVKIYNNIKRLKSCI